MYIIILMCFLIAPIVFFLGLQPSVAIFLVGMGFGIAIISSMAVLFGPRTMLLLNGMDLDKNLNLIKVNDGKGAAVIATEKKAAEAFGPSDDLPKLDIPLEKLLKQGNKASNMELCRQQIVKWQSLLLRIENSALNTNSSANSNSQSRASISRVSMNHGSVDDLVDDADGFNDNMAAEIDTTVKPAAILDDADELSSHYHTA
jgi:hypothetical protein